MSRCLSRDANGVPIQGANGFTLRDANAVQQPVTAPADTPVSIKWPPNAISLNVYPIGPSLMLHDPDNDLTNEAAPVFRIPLSAKTYVEIPGKPGNVTVLEAVSSGTSFYYVFEVLR